MKRLKHGAFKKMTPEQQKIWLRKLAKRWRDNNKEKLKEKHKYWYQRYKRTRPFECFCKICGEVFFAPKHNYKICEKCKIKLAEDVQKRRLEKVEKRRKRLELFEKVIGLAKEGMSQQAIADITGRTQAGVSRILRKNGIHRQQEIFDRAQKKRHNKKKGK